MSGHAAAAILVRQDGRLLFARRAASLESYPGHWEFPGGALRSDESFDEGLRREIDEELGISLSANICLLRQSEFRDDLDRKWTANTYVYRLTSEVPEIREPSKCDAIEFFSPNDPPGPLMPATREDLHYLCSASLRLLETLPVSSRRPRARDQ